MPARTQSRKPLAVILGRQQNVTTRQKMTLTKYKLTTSLFSGLLVLSLTSCNYKTNDKAKEENKQNDKKNGNKF